MAEEFIFKTADQKELQAYSWKAKNPAGISMIIIHGMAEHALRYEAFAQYLNNYGISVFSYDQRGFGKSASAKSKLGFPESNNAWELYKADALLFTNLILEKHPDEKLILFGHSFGSFVARAVLFNNSEKFAGAVISGTTQNTALENAAGLFLSSYFTSLYGPQHRSTLLNKLAFYNFNKKFRKEGKSSFYFLSREKQEVQKYDDDPLCGFPCTNQFYSALFRATSELNIMAEYMNIRKDLPLLIISGEDDAVGKFGKAVKAAYRKYAEAGLTNVILKLYPDARHELLNETNRDDVMECIKNWILDEVEKQKLKKN